MSNNGLRGNTTKRESLRAQAFRMYGKTCNYCGDVGLEVDHVIELAAGGENSIENLQVLCKNCHKIKTSKFNSSRFKGTRGVFSGASARGSNTSPWTRCSSHPKASGPSPT
jgi:5-methylcytosine-specific restriction endonuclease McrA